MPDNRTMLVTMMVGIAIIVTVVLGAWYADTHPTQRGHVNMSAGIGVDYSAGPNGELSIHAQYPHLRVR